MCQPHSSSPVTPSKRLTRKVILGSLRTLYSFFHAPPQWESCSRVGNGAALPLGKSASGSWKWAWARPAGHEGEREHGERGRAKGLQGEDPVWNSQGDMSVDSLS